MSGDSYKERLLTLLRDPIQPARQPRINGSVYIALSTNIVLLPRSSLYRILSFS